MAFSDRHSLGLSLDVWLFVGPSVFYGMVHLMIAHLLDRQLLVLAFLDRDFLGLSLDVFDIFVGPSVFV